MRAQARARAILPAGAVLVRWDPDADRKELEATVMWLVLRPDKWNGDAHLAWRWHPDELARRQRAACAACGPIGG